MPRKRVRGKRRLGGLDYFQRWDLLLREGWSQGSPFPDPESRKQAWLDHREELIAASIANIAGLRPAAFWYYDLPGVGDRRRTTEWEHLVEGGHCGSDEIARIYLQWEKQLDQFGQLLADYGRDPYGLDLADYQRQADLFDHHGYAASDHLRRATDRTVFNQMKVILLKAEGKD